MCIVWILLVECRTAADIALLGVLYPWSQFKINSRGMWFLLPQLGTSPHALLGALLLPGAWLEYVQSEGRPPGRATLSVLCFCK
jgi:hypothetical protein